VLRVTTELFAADPTVIRQGNTYKMWYACGDPADPYPGKYRICYATSGAPDTTPPVLTLPWNMIIEAAGPTGAPATFTASATDDVDGSVPVTCTPASGSISPIGPTTVSCSATDVAGNVGTGTFTVTVHDRTSPVLTLTVPPPVEATSPGGALVRYAVSAFDVVDGPFPAVCTPPSDSVFPVGTTTVACEAVDHAGNIAKGTITVTVQDTTPPTVSLASAFSLNEGSQITISISSASDVASEPLSFKWFLVGPGTLTGTGTSAIYFGANGPSTATVSVAVSDTHGNSTTATTTVTVSNVPPIITSLTGPVAPMAVGTASIGATFTDPGTTDTHVCRVTWGDAATSYGTVNGTSKTCSATHAYEEAGLYTVGVTITDSDGASDTRTLGPVVVFDPNAGFVTGGGWINSPVGAYVANPSVTGRVNFGFNAKYLNNQARLTGQTEFQVQLADINFHSTGSSWLVVTGPNASTAVWDGIGTINGAGSYYFQFTVVDGDRDGTKIDRMRMRIWEVTSGTVIYDTGGSLLPLAGGGIVIHAG
jgi:hypothetical protein